MPYSTDTIAVALHPGSPYTVAEITRMNELNAEIRAIQEAAQLREQTMTELPDHLQHRADELYELCAVANLDSGRFWDEIQRAAKEKIASSLEYAPKLVTDYVYARLLYTQEHRTTEEPEGGYLAWYNTGRAAQG